MSKFLYLKQILQKYFEKRPEIKFAYLFGSVAQKRDNPLSDIDIAVMLDYRYIEEDLYPYGYKANLITDLIKILKTDKIDVVLLDKAPILLRHRVIYYGCLVFSRDEKERINFQVETIKKYNDYKYIIKPHIKAG